MTRSILLAALLALAITACGKKEESTTVEVTPPAAPMEAAPAAPAGDTNITVTPPAAPMEAAPAEAAPAEAAK